MYSAVYVAVHSAVYSAVGGAVYSAVYSAVYGAVYSSVYSAVDGAVYSAVYSAVYGAVYSAVYNAVYGAVYSGTYQHLYNLVVSPLGCPVERGELVVVPGHTGELHCLVTILPKTYIFFRNNIYLLFIIVIFFGRGAVFNLGNPN